jgi:hypothetical protein
VPPIRTVNPEVHNERQVTTYTRATFNLLAPEFYIQVLAHPLYKMWIIQEPKKVALWNKWHFEEKNGECAACLKYSVLIFVEKKYIYIKCNIWRVVVCLSYIEDARFLKVNYGCDALYDFCAWDYEIRVGGKMSDMSLLRGMAIKMIMYF